jgi:dTDP-4-dehydrorhamnose 3,5-epimerase
MPDLTPDAKRVFTVQSYAPAERIDGVAVVELRRFHDDGGAMTELARLTNGRLEAFPDFEVRQVNYSVVAPGAIKAFHLHTRQTDVWYVPPSDRMLIVLVDVRAGAPTEGRQMRFMLGSGASRIVRIPPGVAHGARNLGGADGRIIYFVDVQFSADPSECDEGRLPWDYAGAEVWDVARG